MAEKDAAHKMQDVTGQFKDIVKDLFNIEVNTILRDNISAQKMPNPRHAMVDIGKEYFESLRKMEHAYRIFLWQSGLKQIESGDVEFDNMRRGWGFYMQEEIDAGLPDGTRVRLVVPTLVREQFGGFAALDIMRTWACRFMDDPQNVNYLTKAEISILPRIKDNADMLKGMFSTICRRDNKLKEKGLARELEKIPRAKLTPNTIVELSLKIDLERTLMLTNQYTRSDIVNDEDIPPLPVKDSELVMVRKVWELGTEIIAMQTIIQVDGDVITRLNPNFMDEKKYPDLKTYHNEGVAIALRYWGDLITIAKELVLAIGQGVTGKQSS